MRHGLYIGLVVSGAVFAVALGRLIPALSADGLPQVPGENVLALVLGDARQILGDAMLHKADEYFHGGVRDIACEHGLSAQDSHEAHAGHGHEAEEHEGEAGAPRALPGASRDPWVWLNARVHAQEHRHVEGDEARELLPWLWAACRASPKNIEALETSAYVLSRMNNRPVEALELLESGIRKNPESASLEFARGGLLLHTLHDAARAEKAFAEARRKCRPAAGPDGEDDRLLLIRTLFYLGYLAHQRGDRPAAEACLRDAEAVNPKHVVVQNLRNVLQAQ